MAVRQVVFRELRAGDKNMQTSYRFRSARALYWYVETFAQRKWLEGQDVRAQLRMKGEQDIHLVWYGPVD